MKKNPTEPQLLAGSQEDQELEARLISIVAPMSRALTKWHMFARLWESLRVDRGPVGPARSFPVTVCTQQPCHGPLGLNALPIFSRSRREISPPLSSSVMLPLSPRRITAARREHSRPHHRPICGVTVQLCRSSRSRGRSSSGLAILQSC